MVSGADAKLTSSWWRLDVENIDNCAAKGFVLNTKMYKNNDH